MEFMIKGIINTLDLLFLKKIVWLIQRIAIYLKEMLESGEIWSYNELEIVQLKNI